jgi:hypothetical protein
MFTHHFKQRADEILVVLGVTVLWFLLKLTVHFHTFQHRFIMNTCQNQEMLEFRA